MKAINLLFFVLNGALFAVGGFFIYSRGYQPGVGFGQYELITLVLAALAVLLTALGLFIAILAIWGYSTLKQAAMDQANQAAHITAQKTAETVAARVAEKVAGRRVQGTEGGDYGAAAAAAEEEPNADEQAPRG